MADTERLRYYAPQQLENWAHSVLLASGSQPSEAAQVSQHLVESNLVGHDSHGIIRITKYLDWVAKGMLVQNRHLAIVSERGPILVGDGGFGYGQVIGLEAMQVMAERTKSIGMCTLALRNSGHLGRIGAWAEALAAAGLASFHFVNTSGFGILVAPFGGSDRRLSANPLAAGVPLPGQTPIILDIATSIVAEGKIQVARNKGEAIPENAVVDGRGKPTTDPAAFYADPPGAILPFGGHKGSGLSIFCEILAGSLTGGGSSHPDNPTAGRLVNNMLTLAFDPAAFGGADVFRQDVERLAAWTRASPPAEPGGQVLLPGDIERLNRVARLRDGIPLDAETVRQLTAVGERHGAPLVEVEQ
jgi:uncharacterized oxidoreductase